MPITTRRVRHETRFRRCTVVSNTRITPLMVRIVVTSPDLEGFVSLGFDDHVRIFLPQPGQALPTPDRGEKGLNWPDPKPETRDYTPRMFNPERLELTLDFVVHEGGPAADWAVAARPGDELGVGGPRGSFVVEGEAEWHLLMGDATALPAIGRRIEELPAGANVRAVIEVRDAGEEQRFDAAANPDVTWLHAANGASLWDYLDTLELPKGEGFVFFAAEAGMVEKARERFGELGHPTSRLKAANYWRAGIADSHEH